MFLPVMALHYNAVELQYMSIPRIMWEKIAKYQDDVAFGKINCDGGCAVETDVQVEGLYPGKYGL